MRNFILSPNFKNSVKSSLMSLVILIASLSFGCCLNASAMFNHSPHAYPSDNSSNNNLPSSVASSNDKTARDGGYPSSFVFPNEDRERDNNTEPIVIINLSKDVDNEKIKHNLMLTKQTNLSTIEIADKRFPNDPVKRSLYADELRSFFHSLSGYHTVEEALARFERDISIPQDGAKWLSPSKTSRKYSNDYCDEYWWPGRDESSPQQLDDNDSCDEYWESKYNESLPIKKDTLLESPKKIDALLERESWRDEDCHEDWWPERKKFSPEKIYELLEFEKNLQNS